MFLRREADIPTGLVGTELADVVPTGDLEQVLRFGSTVLVPGGTVLMGEETFGREFLIVLDGTVSVEREGSELATLGAGDIVGEISILNDVPRTATVTSIGEAAVVAFTRREMLSALAASEAFDGFVRKTAAVRQAA